MQLVSSFTHLSGHYWAYTQALIRAVDRYDNKISVVIHASRPPRDRNFTQILRRSSDFEWKACSSFFSRILPPGHRSRNWASKHERLLRIYEFKRCLGSAVSHAHQGKGSRHIHCVEASHRLLMKAVLANPELTFSFLCVGSPPPRRNQEMEALYREAFATGRLTQIVETRSVHEDWESLAGGNVIHIPPAISEEPGHQIDPSIARKRLGLPRDQIVCLLFGTHRDSKDYKTVVAAASESKTKPFLFFAGPLISGNDPSLLLKEAHYHNGKCLLDFLPAEEIPHIFAASDFVVLPYPEGYSKGSAVLLQACQFDRPVVVPETGLFAEFLREWPIGEAYLPGDVDSLAKCFDRLGEFDEVGDQLRAAKAAYSWATLFPCYRIIFRGDHKA